MRNVTPATPYDFVMKSWTNPEICIYDMCVSMMSIFVLLFWMCLFFLYIHIYLCSCMTTLCPPSPLQLRQCGGFSPLGDGCTVRSSNVGEPFCGHQWRSKRPGCHCKSRIYPLSSSSSSSAWSSPSAHVGHIIIHITYHCDDETNIIITMIMMFLAVNSCLTWVWTSMHIINIILTIILIIHIFPLLWYLCGIYIYIYILYIHVFLPYFFLESIYTPFSSFTCSSSTNFPKKNIQHTSESQLPPKGVMEFGQMPWLLQGPGQR